MPIGTKVLQGGMDVHWWDVLQYARRAKYGSWPQHFAQVRNPLIMFRAASGWPLLQWFLGALVMWSNFHFVANLANSAFINCGPLSIGKYSEIPCSANNSFMIDALYWDEGFCKWSASWGISQCKQGTQINHSWRSLHHTNARGTLANSAFINCGPLSNR